MTGWQKHSMKWFIVLCVCIGVSSPMPAPGGHFRSGSLAWMTAEGNTVEFELQTAWRRSFEGFYVNGLPAMGEIYEGDIVTIGGASSPVFDFGDGSSSFVNVRVTSFSIIDDWIFGVTVMNHTYSTPNRGYREDVDRYGDLHITQGAPWSASFTGCCRLSNLQNQAGESWNMTASLDLQQSSGFPSLRSMATIAFPRTPDDGLVPLCAFLSAPSNAGPCTKLELSTLACADHQSGIGEAGGFALARAAETPGVFQLTPGGVLRMPCSGGCPPAGLYSVPALVHDGRVAHVRVVDDGAGGACEAGVLQASGGTPERALAGSYSVSGGRIAGVVISDHGSGYDAAPTVRASGCAGAALAAEMLSAPLSVLAAVQPRHACTGDGTCDPSIPGVGYSGVPLPSLHPSGFPFIGHAWDPAALRVVPPAAGFEAGSIVGGGAGGVQTSHGHAVAFAGREWAVRLQGEVNWCQALDGAVPPSFRTDPRCIVPDAHVTVGLSRLPEGAEVWTEQADAVVELLVTYDNPFEAHRPGHQGAVARSQRALVGQPSAEEALRLGFERVDANLNAGAGGASVFLWLRRFDPAGDPAAQRAITHINVSADAAADAALADQGFEQLAGDLNLEAGGPPVHLWFRRASGPVPFSPRRPADDGAAVGIADLAVLPAPDPPPPSPPAGADANPYLNGTQAVAEWEAVGGDLNLGVGPGLRLWVRRGVANPWAHRVRWRPCACDVGRHYLCAAALSSAPAAGGGERARSEQLCLALDVLPDALPQFRAPDPAAPLRLFVGRELRTPVAVAVEDPDKHVTIAARPLPPGAALDAPYLPAEGCEGEGGCYWRARDVVWTPAWNQGGLEAELCFTAEDPLTGCEPAGQAPRSEVCVRAAVARCVYALQREQHLQEVAALFGTDWLNLYSMNPALTAPDRLLHPGQLLNFGHNYSVVAGDTAANIAMRFGTSVEMLLAANADLAAADSILVGQLLCLIPDACHATHH